MGGAFGLIRFSSDEDDLRILGFEIFHSWIFFWVGKFDKYFLACLHLGRDFVGPRAFVVCVVLPDKVQQTCFAMVCDGLRWSVGTSLFGEGECFV